MVSSHWYLFAIYFLTVYLQNISSDESEHMYSRISKNKLLGDILSMSSLIGHSNITNSSLPLCHENQHNEGQWVLHKDIVDKDFFCCSWDEEEDFKSSSEFCGESFPYSIVYPGSNLRYTFTGGHGCRCDKRFRTRRRVAAREQYVWKPTNCRLLPWDGKQFCQLLNHRKMLFMGDSTMVQTFATISSMIYEHGGGCADDLMNIMNSKLQVTPDITSNISLEFPITTLFPAVQVFMPSIIMVSAGPHFHHLDEYDELIHNLDNNFLTPFYNPKLFDTNMKFVIRGNHPGHVKCKTYKVPLNTSEEVKTMNSKDDKYDWKHADEFDQRMEALVTRIRHRLEHKPTSKLHSTSSSSNLPSRVHFLDTYPLYFRPDAHVDEFDCLHYCLPGALNIEANILLTKLYTGEY